MQQETDDTIRQTRQTLARQLRQGRRAQQKAEREMVVFEAIINSMTPYERRHPEILRYSHKNRIAKGSGLTNADVNRVIRRYEDSKKIMKQMKQYQGKPGGGFRF